MGEQIRWQESEEGTEMGILLMSLHCASLLGALLVLGGGLLSGSAAWPMKLMKRYQFEHWWFVAMPRKPPNRLAAARPELTRASPPRQLHSTHPAKR